MANYTLAAGDRGVWAKDLVADTEDVITVAQATGSRHPRYLRLWITAPAYVTTDGTPAVVGDPKTVAVGLSTLGYNDVMLDDGNDKLRIIGPQDTQYWVERL